MHIDFSSITGSWGYILSGALYTLELTVITAIGGLFLGTLLPLCHLGCVHPVPHLLHEQRTW